MAKVTVIPPVERQTAALRVAAYCRVSSDSADQLHSYATQVKSYTKLIEGHAGWELVDIYADEGRTGTKLDKRDEFNRMMRDCRKGKIDKVLVKSVSRFARNTRDCLVSLRELSQLGVAVQFEEDHIDTETLTTELMVSVSGSLAQEESVSISKNQRMSYQRRMERGEFSTCFAPYGYHLRDGKHLEIYEPQAQWVRWMFDQYLCGQSANEIAVRLQKQNVPQANGKCNWGPRAVTYILTNEKYIGDSLCQKTCSANTFPFRRRYNRGESDRFYVEGTQEAIISKDTFEKVQALMRRKRTRETVTVKTYLFTKRIYCGKCGSVFVRKTGKNGYTAWCCAAHNRKADQCDVGRISEDAIKQAFVTMLRKLKTHEDIILKPVIAQLHALEEAMHRNNPDIMALNLEIAQMTEQSYKISQLQTKGLLDADMCAAKFAAVEGKLTTLRAKRQQLICNGEMDDAIEAVKQTVDVIHGSPADIQRFDEDLFRILVERITAESSTQIRFHLKGGMEFAETIRR